jgi:hypothetical protein
MGCHLFDAPYKALQLGYPSGVQCSVVDVYKEMWRPEYTPEACPLAAKVAIDFPTDKNNPNGVVFEWMEDFSLPFRRNLRQLLCRKPMGFI